MATVERNQVKMNYHICGTGKITLLFVHGAFIDQHYWKSQVDYFSREYKVVTIDLPGHGMSGQNRELWNIQEYGKDVCFLIRELNLKNVILIGHSMGGDVILETAILCPESLIGMIGIDNFKNAGTPMPPEIQGQMDYILQLLKTDFAKTSETFARLALLSENTPPPVTDKVIHDFRSMNEKIGYQLIADSFSYHARERELLLKLSIKLHLLNVTYQPTNEAFLQSYARAGYHLTEIQGTSHYPMIELLPAFNQSLEVIIQSIAKSMLF